VSDLDKKKDAYKRAIESLNDASSNMLMAREILISIDDHEATGILHDYAMLVGKIRDRVKAKLGELPADDRSS